MGGEQSVIERKTRWFGVEESRVIALRIGRFLLPWPVFRNQPITGIYWGSRIAGLCLKGICSTD